MINTTATLVMNILHNNRRYSYIILAERSLFEVTFRNSRSLERLIENGKRENTEQEHDETKIWNTLFTILYQKAISESANSTHGSHFFDCCLWPPAPFNFSIASFISRAPVLGVVLLIDSANAQKLSSDSPPAFGDN